MQSAFFHFSDRQQETIFKYTESRKEYTGEFFFFYMKARQRSGKRAPFASEFKGANHAASLSLAYHTGVTCALSTAQLEQMSWQPFVTQLMTASTLFTLTIVAVWARWYDMTNEF